MYSYLINVSLQITRKYEVLRTMRTDTQRWLSILRKKKNYTDRTVQGKPSPFRIQTSLAPLSQCLRSRSKFKAVEACFSFYIVLPFTSMSLREYPCVWDRFERNVGGGGTMKFVVEDISEAMWSTAVEFMLGNYIEEDVWWNTAGTARDPEAVQEYRVLLTSIIRQKMSLACFLAEGDGYTLVGVNMCMLQKKGHFVDHDPPKTEAGLLSLRMFAEAMKVPVIYDKYGVGEYLMGAGLSVAPEYRRLGIATKLLTARSRLAKSLGLRAMGGIFTSASGQKAAEKAGMECLYSIPYTKFGKRCNIKFNSSTEELKIFGKRTE